MASSRPGPCGRRKEPDTRHAAVRRAHGDRRRLAALFVTAQERVDSERRPVSEPWVCSDVLGPSLDRTLTDELGARLTASPSHTAAARWARDRFEEWGLANSHLEPFEFGRGWALEKISVEMTTPRYMPLIGYAEAWTPSMPAPVQGRVVYVGNKSAARDRRARRPTSQRDRADPPAAIRVRRVRPPAARAR